MKRTLFLSLVISIVFMGCSKEKKSHFTSGDEITLSQYFDNTGRDDINWGGIKMVTISTPSGDFDVWTKRTVISAA